jgi:hypothetical protein
MNQIQKVKEEMLKKEGDYQKEMRLSNLEVRMKDE